jgi:hypothetical protein
MLLCSQSPANEIRAFSGKSLHPRKRVWTPVFRPKMRQCEDANSEWWAAIAVSK